MQTYNWEDEAKTMGVGGGGTQYADQDPREVRGPRGRRNRRNRRQGAGGGGPSTTTTGGASIPGRGGTSTTTTVSGGQAGPARGGRVRPPRRGAPGQGGGAQPFPSQGQGVGRTSSPAGAGTGEVTQPSVYNSSIRGATVAPPPGSFATGFPSVFTNPEAMTMAAENPMLIANKLMADRYGLPSGSYSAGAFADYLDPTAKAYGILGELPGNNIDWVNFGAELMGMSGMAPGSQLSPEAMMKTMVSTVMQGMQGAMKGGGGPGAEGAYNPLRDLAYMNPAEALPLFVSLVKGALQGTMPDEQLNGYLSWLQRVGDGFVDRWVHGDMRQMEASGDNFMSALIKQLGPTMGL